MKKYLIKETSKATNQNPNFAGETAIGYYGKNQHLIAYLGDHAEKHHMKQDLYEPFIKEYGYDRFCDAKRSWVYKNPENTEYWSSTVEIIEVEVA